MKALPIVLILVALMLGACGKNNESGKKKSNGWASSLNLPGTTSSGVTNLVSQMVSLPCAYGGNKVHVQFPLNMTVAVSALYLGITSEGDVATVTSSNGQGLFSAYICPRPGSTGQGALTRNPAVGRSVAGCLVDEITAASMQLASQAGYPYYLNFRAIHYGLPANSPYAAQFNQMVQQVCRGY